MRSHATFCGVQIHSQKMNLSHENSDLIRETLEDTVEYLCTEAMNSGDPISGETAWAVVECLAIAKQAELQGLVSA